MAVNPDFLWIRRGTRIKLIHAAHTAVGKDDIGIAQSGPDDRNAFYAIYHTKKGEQRLLTLGHEVKAA